jgi:hypothetical protein
MIFNPLLSINFFVIFISINANQQFHFGIINHHTQWYFHCPQNHTKILAPPSKDQSLISYECQQSSLSIEVVPIELDFTFLCHLKSRLIWIIVDLYQYNTYVWLINSKDIEIKIELNHQIKITNSTIELQKYTNHYIIINAFYIPFESINILLNQPIEINIQIKNLNQLNQCQFLIKDNYLWQTFLNNYCDLNQPKTFFIQSAKCEFYTNQLQSANTNLPVQVIDDLTTTNIPDFHVILSIDHGPNLTTPSTSYHYIFLEGNYRQILSSLARSTSNSILLKFTFIFLIIILILLIVFFLYMLCYHYHNRSRLLLSTKNPSVGI